MNRSLKSSALIILSTCFAWQLASADAIVVAPTEIILTADDGDFTDSKRTFNGKPVEWLDGTKLWDASIVETGDPLPAVLPTHAYGIITPRIRSGAPMDPLPELTIALGGSYDLAGVILWNHGEGLASDDYSDRGIKTVTASFSTDGGKTFKGSEKLSFNKGPQGRAPIVGELVDFSRRINGVTHVRFSEMDTFAGVPESGTHLQCFAELRFVADR